MLKLFQRDQNRLMFLFLIFIFNFFEENQNYFMTLFLLMALFHGT